MAKSSKRKFEDSCETNKIRIKHKCITKTLVKANETLMPWHRAVLERTPFRWIRQITQKLSVSCPLLEELSLRWDERRGGFMIKSKLVRFTPLHVCLSLGLRIVGESVPLVEQQGTRTESLFKGRPKTVDSIVELLQVLNRQEDADDFCRLYILLALTDFYFPNTTSKVNVGFFGLLDDLSSIDRYNWGMAVHDSVVSGITKSASTIYEAKNSHQLTVTGCVAVLQLWALEHVSIWDNGHRLSSISFPRFLEWKNLPMTKSAIEKIFQHNQVIHDLTPTNDEIKQHGVLLEALKETTSSFCHQNSPPHDDDLRRKYDMLSVQYKELENRFTTLEEEVKSFKNLLAQQQPSPSTIMPSTAGPFALSSLKDAKKNFLNNLFNFCTRRTKDDVETKMKIVSMFHQHLTRHDLQSMRHRSMVNNVVFLLASKVFMFDQKRSPSCVDRYMFPHLFVDMVAQELKQSGSESRITWGLRTIKNVAHDGQACELIKDCKLIFAPALVDSHWFCYVVDKKKKCFYVLDSLGNARYSNKDLHRLDEYVKHAVEDMLYFLDKTLDKDSFTLKLVYANLPRQHTGYDCGIYVLKYMEIWDGDDQTFPNYSKADIDKFRQDFVCHWVLHPQNKCRNTVLATLDL